MCLKKSFEDPPTPAVGDYVAGGVLGLGAARVCDRIFAAFGLSLPGPATRRSRSATTHERDRGDARALWLQPHSYPSLLYTSDAADERSSVDLGGCRVII